MMGTVYWENVFILKLVGHQPLADFSLLLLFGFPLKKYASVFLELQLASEQHLFILRCIISIQMMA